MKPMVVDVQRYGSLGGEEVAMTFDENSIAHIMSVLTDLYSDSAMAVIREYATNAYDSHVEAGVDLPIEIVKPTYLDPTLKIIDHGVGMSREDLVNTYSKYGASTKRATDEQTGTLGLGCKSGLTYTSQFTVTAVKNSIKTIVNVSRAEDGSGMMELVDSRYCDEPSGVTISIPVSDIHDMESKIDEFFRYWKPGTVLVDGKQPTPIDGIDVTDSIKLVPNGRHDIIVMGNVPYRLDNSHQIVSYGGWYRNYSVVAWLPIGAVAFTPNREDLRYTDQTEKAIKAVTKEFLDNFNAQLNNEIQQADSPGAAIRKYVDLSIYKNIAGCDLKKEWRGKSFSDAFNIGHIEFNTTASRHQTHWATHLEIKSIYNSVFITGFPSTTLSSFYKQKIRKMLDGSVESQYTVRIVSDETLPEWYSDAIVYTWEDVKAVTLSDSGRSYGGQQGPQLYRVLNSHGYFEEQSEIDPDAPIYFDTYAEWRGTGHVLAKIFDVDDQVVLISRNRWDKFQRIYPNAKRIEHGKEIKRQEFIDSIPQDVLVSLTVDDRDALANLDEAKVDDPALKSQIIAAKIDCSQWLAKFALFSNSFTPIKSELAKYTLIDSWYLKRRIHKHLYIYINAVYNELFKESK